MTLAEVFDHAFKHVKFDSKLVKAIYECQIGYINRDREHLAFFGSNLLGVHVVRFKDSDINAVFDALDVDYFELTEQIKKVKAISQDFKVSSDTFNLTMMYLIHKFMTSPIINDIQRHRASYDCALLFFYRCIAALLSYYFRYPTDPKIAQMAYANLSQKYLIKKLGSWHRVMDYRAEDLIAKDSIHNKSLISFNNDFAIVYAINDSQGRIKDLVKNYCTEFYSVRTEGDRISTTSSTYLDMEGEETIREKTRGVETYVDYILSIVDDTHSFVKMDLVSVICKINTNTSQRMVTSVLTWISENHTNPQYNKIIDDFLSRVIVHSFYLLNDNANTTNLRDYPTILVNLKNLYLASRSADKDLAIIRDMGTDIIRDSQGEISHALVMATRTAIILYITLRTLVGKK